MAQRPSSPTSLLWAHQLKREHGYLLKRMQDLEASNERQAKRIKTVESNPKPEGDGDIAALASKMRALDEGGFSNRLSKLENEMRHKTEELEAGTEAITIQVAAMQKAVHSHDEEKRKAFKNEKALLKRIGDIEIGLSTYQEALVKLGRRVNNTQLEQIKDQLNALAKQVMEEGEQMKLLAESVVALEAANVELTKSTEKLQAEAERMLKQLVIASCVPKAGANPRAYEADISSGALTGSHKAAEKAQQDRSAVGGSDLTIDEDDKQILRDSAVMSPPSNQRRNANLEAADEEAPKAEKARTSAKAKVKPKLIPPHPQTTAFGSPSTGKKSHKWKGGGADRDIIRSGRGPTTAPGDSFSGKKSHKWAGGGADKEVIRFGKGWLEVAVDSDAEDGPAEATQRPSLRPKKRNPTPRWTLEEALTQGRTSRRARLDQPVVNVEPGRKFVVPQPSVKPKPSSSKAVSKPSVETTLPRPRKPGQNVSASSSPEVAQPQRSTARRRILQD